MKLRRRSLLQGLAAAAGALSIGRLARYLFGRPARARDAEQAFTEATAAKVDVRPFHPLYLAGIDALQLPKAEVGDSCVCAIWAWPPRDPCLGDAQTLMEAGSLPFGWRWACFEALEVGQAAVLIHAWGPEYGLVTGHPENPDVLPRVWRIKAIAPANHANPASFMGEPVRLEI